jgi:hypothetical protein
MTGLLSYLGLCVLITLTPGLDTAHSASLVSDGYRRARAVGRSEETSAESVGAPLPATR